jgi:hydroxymethylpyrimidine/phosphomethylpyrimidine kinase
LLLQFNVPNVVLDPVVVSTSGCRLIDEAALEAIRQHLFPLATVITPNIPETTCLTGVQIHSEQDFDQAASVIHGQKVQAVLFKAGHLDSNVLTDYLYDDKQFIDRYQYHRINTPNTHGTGCTLSSAIASYLALGYPLKEAIRQAEEFLHGAIVAGSDFQTGHGHGPVHHFYRWW